jgi:hypothetical protein
MLAPGDDKMFEPSTVILNDPVAAEFVLSKALICPCPIEIADVALATVPPKDTSTRRLPPRPWDILHDKDDSEVQAEPSQRVPPIDEKTVK